MAIGEPWVGHSASTSSPLLEAKRGAPDAVVGYEAAAGFAAKDDRSDAERATRAGACR